MTNPLEFLRDVEVTGQPLIITDDGVPTLEVRPYKKLSTQDALASLAGSVLYYDDPTGPVGEDDWEALK